jgi:MerR family copper efflux transcriptional regulator
MENDSMNIGEMAKAAGVSAKMIRHYESIGLLSPASRSDSGYRRYGEKDVGNLQFIRHARDLGFSLEEIKNLLGLWQDRTRPSREVKSLAQQHLDFLDKKLEEILSMKTALAHLISCCHGDVRPDCPILEGLAGAKGKV